MLFYPNQVMKVLLLVIIFFTIISCGAGKPSKNNSLQIKFLDDYLIPANFTFQNTKVGGLSGIDYDGENYYVVSDHPSTPRIYRLSISTNNKKIDTILFKGIVFIQKKDTFLKKQTLDLESILFNVEKNEFLLASEGSIKSGKNPFIVKIDSTGNYLEHASLPSYFQLNNEQQPRNNSAFEGLTIDFKNKGFWTLTELPLTEDGPKPKLHRTKSPVRFTLFNTNLEAIKQFSYLLEPIQKIPFIPFSLNGATDLLEIAPEKFIVIERSYAAGRGKGSHNVLLFYVDATNADNTLSINYLKNKINKKIVPAKKELIFNFNSIRKLLKGKQIDNLEGICFGPKLPNGNQTLILVADNNFNSFTRQLNQVVWLEIIPQ